MKFDFENKFTVVYGNNAELMKKVTDYVSQDIIEDKTREKRILGEIYAFRFINGKCKGHCSLSYYKRVCEQYTFIPVEDLFVSKDVIKF